METSLLLTDAEKEVSKLYKRNRFKEAESLYDVIIKQLESVANESSDENSESQLAWKKVIAKAYNNRGHSRYMQVCFDEANEDYDVAIAYDPKLAVAYYNRGTIHYRLCQGQALETGDRRALLQDAVSDFMEAKELEPENPEFSIGLENCEKALLKTEEDDGNAINKKISETILKWDEIPTSKQVKLLFLLDNGDKSTGITEEEQQKNAKAVDVSLAAFFTFLRKGNDQAKITNVLKRRAAKLYRLTGIDVKGNTEAANLIERKVNEDLLTFVQACKFLDIECFRLELKKSVVDDTLLLNKEERQGTFFIYAENLRMNWICDQLSSTQVYALYEIVIKDKSVKGTFDEQICISPDKLDTIEGLKETLFFSIIRWMEVNDKLNRIYTYKLEELLTELKKRTDCKEEGRKIADIVENLSTYPIEYEPAGLCVVFCVTQNREGARGEIEKVKNVFGHSLGYAVQVEEDPTYETLMDYVKELSKKKYSFYDSIVFWFMAHGSETNIVLGSDEYDMQSIIDRFCRLDNFRKKPKIFFMASCKGNKPIPVEEKGKKKYAVDGSSVGEIQFLNIPEGAFNITAVYYEMDRLVAHATLPNKYAFRDKESGSVYVNTVCQLLKEHRGDNITQVLEKASNVVHRILFTCRDKFDGEAKQGCYYESTFQKTFKVPTNKYR